MTTYPFRSVGGTLRKHYVVGLVLPVIVLMVCAIRDPQGDLRVGELVRGPTVSEKYRQANAIDPNARREEIPPLVEQAELFAQYLDPARSPGVAAPRIPTVRSPVAPAPNFTSYTAKFTLHGTCYYPSRPEESVALVWQPGGGGGTFQWVRQGARLGRFILEEVKSGAIVYRSGQDKHEMKVQRSPAPMSMVRGHRSGPGPASKGAAGREPVGVNNERVLAQGINEEQAAPQEISAE